MKENGEWERGEGGKVAVSVRGDRPREILRETCTCKWEMQQALYFLLSSLLRRSEVETKRRRGDVG